jgi:hypothetical protein
MDPKEVPERGLIITLISHQTALHPLPLGHVSLSTTDPALQDMVDIHPSPSRWTRALAHPHAGIFFAEIDFVVKDALVQHLEEAYHVPTAQIVFFMMVIPFPIDYLC